MKKLFILFFVLCLIINIAGCDNKDFSNVSDVNIQNGVINIKKLDIYSKDTGSPIGINGNYFYYCTSTDNYNDTSNDSFWQYNFTTGEKKKMGSIENHQTSSATEAFVGEKKLFATYGLVEHGEIYNNHIMFDLEKCEMTVLSKDNFFPTLVYSTPVNESQFLEFQPKKEPNGAYDYLIRIGDKNGNMQTIITKHYLDDQVGEIISDVCVFDNIIYTFEYRYKMQYVCSYDLEGNEISKESIDLLNDFLNTPDQFTGEPEILADIKVINDYYFFSTMNGKKLVLHKTNGEYSKVENLNMDNFGIVDSTDSLDKSDEKVIMFDYDEKELLCFDVNKGELSNLGISLENATYMTTDGEQLIYIDNSELYYIEDVFALKKY